ncbi:DHA2 family efflux MFS transporter permease subunit [Phytoactinopolyspora halotolerans]|uniref:DHA2 family efflux MFS transporter permease subunit n=1 Tax=Phytoactinopolyspora halotolerans TaxID=1981512 RepID=A0A6L9S2B4_9ACTN|nr:DHA2 family efflux MFS transporter permease subunit [Phytoactinopolyspora halotolerans]NED99178.1 DHA2 family efflux MFS transporter permease subunit [Phytoactinopolyspora halotolerans]
MSSQVARRSVGAVFLACSVPMFMAALDNLVVVTSLNVIREDLGASIAELQWFSSAYIVAFAGLLLVAAGFGDRLGRRAVFTVGIGLFTVASLLCGFAETPAQLIAARAAQGAGAATLTPLSLTLLAAAVPERRRGLAIGLWSAANGAAISLGPVVGGAVASGLEWRWVFWINVPIGAIALVLARRLLTESRGADVPVDVAGMVLISAAIVAGIWGLVNAPEEGWTAPGILTSFGLCALLTAAAVAWQSRVRYPLIPGRLLRIRAFTLTNVACLCMHFGVFGSIFLLAQLLQVAYGYDPFEAGLRTMVWTVMPMLVSPFAGILTPRIGGGRLMAAGLALQGVGLWWIAVVAAPGQAFGEIVAPMMIAGAGMGLVFAPTATTVLAVARPEEHGKASGANTTVREFGGALGIAVLTSVFQMRGSYGDAQAFTDGVVDALHVAVPVVLAGAVVALLIPRDAGRVQAVGSAGGGEENSGPDPARPGSGSAPPPRGVQVPRS